MVIIQDGEEIALSSEEGVDKVKAELPFSRSISKQDIRWGWPV